MNTRSHYDVVIIGAGMAGLAAGIRLAHFGRQVCIFERHNAVGGLNGFYSRDGRRYDVGLHALTNYVPPGVKGTPLTKLLRQLRIDRDELALRGQLGSRIAFGPGVADLRFTNDFQVLEAEVARAFPAQIDGFRALVAAVRAHDEVSLDAAPASAREVVRRHLRDPLLEDMLFCPVMFYGSPTERDMDFSQFVILFKALFLEGFARPAEGVRRILRVLLAKYREAGGERRMKCGVRRIVLREGRAAGVELDDGAVITADHVLSSAGAPATEALLSAGGLRTPSPTAPGRLSFVETISVLDRPPAALGWSGDTIVFFSEGRNFDYVCPEAPVDIRSGVICLPNNFAYEPGEALAEGWFRVTALARPEDWAAWPEPEYRARKQEWFGAVQTSARRFLPTVPDADLAASTVATDMFTPRTITRFTGHPRGAVYGAGVKHRRGLTAAPNVYLCGTDQGFLGIVGAMLSGISMANHHILQRG